MFPRRRVALLVALLSAHAASAAITAGGDTIIATLSSQDSTVGKDGAGTLSIDGASVLNNGNGYIGYAVGSAGSATVSGVGSTWSNSKSVYVGRFGNGSLTVSDGGLLTAQTLFASPSALFGNGIIDVKGAVLDQDLIFDTSHGTTQVFSFGSGGTLNLQMNGSGALGAGHQANGSLRIQGVTVTSTNGYLGFASNSVGSATIGEASWWKMSSQLYAGYSGHSEMTIENGGQVSSYATLMAMTEGSTAKLRVTGSGSKWTNQAGVDVGVGGSASLEITQGGNVTSFFGNLGNSAAAHGDAIVSGIGSIWNNRDGLYVGTKGTGKLLVESGAQIMSVGARIGWYSGSTGAVTIRGAQSHWSAGQVIFVGYAGRGQLTVANGGAVSTQELRVNDQSAVHLHLSGNDMVVLGNATYAGSVLNDGSIKVYVDAMIPAGVYAPITEFASRPLSWTGTGSVAILGGVFQNANKTVTVAPSTSLAAGEVDSVSSGERLLIVNQPTGRRVGVSFGTLGAGTSFSGVPTGDAYLADLQASLGPDRQILDSWDFTTNLTGGEALISFDIGTSHELADLSMWHRQGEIWSRFFPTTLEYSHDGVVSFTASSFSGYAVAVPEPRTCCLLLGSLILMFGNRSIRRH